MNEKIYYCKSLEDELHEFMNIFMRNSFKKGLIVVPQVQYMNHIKYYYIKRKLPVYHLLENNMDKNGIYIKVDDGNSLAMQQEITAVVHSSYFKNFEGMLNRLNSTQKPFMIYDTRIDTTVEAFAIDRLGEYKREEKIKYGNISRHLINREIYDVFMETFEIANDEINIISPWISNNVVDNELIEKMERALMRGVKIKIKYGIGNTNDRRNEISDEIADLLSNKFSCYKGKFFITKENIHYKLLLCDDKYMVSGSYNFLSFKGTYLGQDNRHEGAEYEVESSKVKELRARYFE